MMLAPRLDWETARRRLAQPGALILAASNLLPLAGALFWGWDVFLVLLVFWFETVIIAFWTVLRIALIPWEEMKSVGKGFGAEPGQISSAFGLALFFAAHSGVFLLVHFMFLMGLFSGSWPSRIGGVGDFFRLVVVGTGLWIGLAGLVVAHGFGFLRQIAGSDSGESALLPLYVRIILMQIAIIFGGMVSVALGSMGPLIILIGVKTVADLALVTDGGDR